MKFKYFFALLGSFLILSCLGVFFFNAWQKPAKLATTTPNQFVHKNREPKYELAELPHPDKQTNKKGKTFLPVLMYHHFVQLDKDASSTTITQKAFSNQMKFLKEKGYHSVTDQDIVDFYYHKKELPPKPIHITMDDGYKSNYDLAYPILKRYKMRATIYVIVSKIGGNLDKTFLPHFTWEQAKEMTESGLISIQNHTFDLHYKEKIGKQEVPALIASTKKSLYKNTKADLELANRLIEYELEKPVLSLAYPFGAFNKQIQAFVREAGIKLAYTVKPGINTEHTNPLELHRLNIFNDWTGQTIEKEINKQKHKTQNL